MRMLRVFAAALAASTIAGAAVAADLPSRKMAPVPAYVPPPVFTWTGLYVGLQAGGVWDRISSNGNTSALLLAPLVSSTVWWGYNSGASTKAGFVGGGHIGGNYQIGAFVLGAEGDLEGASVWSGSLRGSLRGRLGFGLDRALIYATGGMAYGGRNGSSTYGALGYNWGGSTSSSRIGWTAGAGLEYAFTPNWSAGAEYRYSDFGANNSAGVWGLGSNARLTENALRGRVSYHFNLGGSPGVARY